MDTLDTVFGKVQYLQTSDLIDLLNEDLKTVKLYAKFEKSVTNISVVNIYDLLDCVVHVVKNIDEAYAFLHGIQYANRYEKIN